MLADLVGKRKVQEKTGGQGEGAPGRALQSRGREVRERRSPGEASRPRREAKRRTTRGSSRLWLKTTGWLTCGLANPLSLTASPGQSGLANRNHGGWRARPYSDRQRAHSSMITTLLLSNQEEPGIQQLRGGPA